jgi:ribonuclease HI
MTIHAFTDGASRGNPGESGIGIILKEENGSVISSLFGYIGKTTNNVAEYTALITCLKMATKMDCRTLVIHSDSELMVRQIQGTYKIKEPRLKKCADQALKLIHSAPFQCTIQHITRDRNVDADKLANRGIDTKKPIRI